MRRLKLSLSITTLMALKVGPGGPLAAAAAEASPAKKALGFQKHLAVRRRTEASQKGRAGCAAQGPILRLIVARSGHKNSTGPRRAYKMAAETCSHMVSCCLHLHVMSGYKYQFKV